MRLTTASICCSVASLCMTIIMLCRQYCLDYVRQYFEKTRVLGKQTYTDAQVLRHAVIGDWTDDDALFEQASVNRCGIAHAKTEEITERWNVFQPQAIEPL